MLITPDFGYGGAEKSFAALSRELANHHEVVVVVFNDDQKPVYPLGGNVHSLGVSSTANPITKIYHLFLRITRLKSFKKKIKPDISISFLEGADYINILSRYNKAEKIVCSIRGSKKFDQNIYGWGRLIREKLIWPFLYREANLIVTVNHGITKEIATYIGRKNRPAIKVVPNSIDTKKIALQATEPLPDVWQTFFTHNKTLISVGRLAPEKGFDHFLTIFRQLTTTLPDVKYVIIGNGPRQQYLLQLCRKLNLKYYLPDDDISGDNQVYFLGYKSNPVKYIAAADIFVLPSLHEGYPNALLEAMHAHVKIAAADCPYGPREIIAEIKDYDKTLNYPIKANNAWLLPELRSLTNETISQWVSALKELATLPTPTNIYPIKQAEINWQKVIEEL